MTIIDDGDAFDRALAESESRLAVIRRARAQVGVARRVQAGSGAVALGVIAVALLSTDRFDGQGGPRVVVSLFIAAFGLAAVLVAQAVVVLPLCRKVATEERVMLSEVNRLRELFVNVARREEWSRERIRAARQRLSQFPIEGGAFR
ncbi:hypothetical protein K2224_37205 (plasmid) [Streptomyces sp. BHT-5-2]|uniref:hypothetical protein n=1 Tax=unclassified Streptomyces TaxID=2593676 RepID=UPI001C8E3AAA|nr:hypothetical protein [Streptomyces sp. BHT-5-2]QZL08695.1 hypothetical protein K2224_37205 [Streptomyces sp. BHT-5-2]